MELSFLDNLGIDYGINPFKIVSAKYKSISKELVIEVIFNNVLSIYDYDNFVIKFKERLTPLNIKVCLTSSSGGHFMQLKQLFKMTKKYNTFIFTEKNEIAKGYSNKYKMSYLKQQERKNAGFVFEFIYNLLKAFWIVFYKNPDVVISTGAGATTFVCLFVKLFGGKVIYIESFAKINSKTITGKIVYKFADEFYVQWEEMQKLYPKAHYNGGIY